MFVNQSITSPAATMECSIDKPLNSPSLLIDALNASYYDDLFTHYNDDDKPQNNNMSEAEISRSKYHVSVPSILIPSNSSISDGSTVYSSDDQSTHSVHSSPSIINDDSSPSIITDTPSPSDIQYDGLPIITSSNHPTSIAFDIHCIDGKYLMSSKGFDSGCHEWTVKILKCDTYRQEIGIVSNLNVTVEIGNCGGIRDAEEFGARAIYGNIPDVNTAYHASYNDDNSRRCYKNLTCNQWSEGDEIKICLDLENGDITFLLNGTNIGKAISIQKYQKYHPFISFSGHCKYEIYG